MSCARTECPCAGQSASRSIPEGLQLDGELVALADDGRPDFHRLSSRMLHGRTGNAATFFVFDMLAVEALSTTMLPYSERRAILEELDVENQRVRLVATFEDGEALFAAVCARGLEGVVAKRERDPYRPWGSRVGQDEESRDRSFCRGTRGRRSSARPHIPCNCVKAPRPT